MGLIYSDLLAQNYKVLSSTSQELAILLSEQKIPAVLVIAGAESDFTLQDSAIISEYLWQGGTLLVMIEPENTPDGIKTFLYKYGITTISFILGILETISGIIFKVLICLLL